MAKKSIFPDDIKPKEIYEFDWMKDFVIIGQLTYSYRTFGLIEIIKNIEKLKKFIESKNYLDNSLRFEFLKNNDFLFHRMFDIIKIGIVFENFFKAKLLLNDIIIHKINPKGNLLLEKLSKKQYKNPIERSELESIVGDKSKIKEYISENTICYSTMLTHKSYNHLFSIKPETIEFLTEINKERNNIHLLYGDRITFSKKEISNFEEIMNLVKYDISYLHKVLIEKIDPDSMTKIPIKF